MQHTLRAISLLAVLPVLSSCDSEPVTVYGDTAFYPDESEVVDAIIPEPSIQYALPARGSIYANTKYVGGTRGTDFGVTCDANQVLAGISGMATELINQVSPLCVEVDNSGNWVGSPEVTGDAIGGASGSAFSQVCSVNRGVVGFTATTESSATGYLQLHCRDLVDESSSAGEMQSLNGAGNAVGATPKILCSENAVAKGLFGKFAASINNIGLTCKESPAYAGRWSNVIDWPLIAIHSVLTPEGKVMSFGSTIEGSPSLQGAHLHYDVWDPQQGTSDESHMTLVNTLGVDSFCAAAVVMPENGNVLMPGGDGRPDGNVNKGIFDAPILNPVNYNLSRAANMNTARWYPTALTLPSGDILLTGGRDGSGQHAVTPEVYSPQTDEWNPLPGINTSGYPFMYPRQWVTSDGRIFGVNGRKMYFMDTSGNGQLNAVAGTIPNVSHGTSSTAVMYAPGKILQVGGAGIEGFGAIAIDINSGTPEVRTVESMAQSRGVFAESVVLPDGTVLVMGGSRTWNNVSNAALGAELWDPLTERWTQLSTSQLARLYHSTAVLLKDGTVLLAGGGAPGPLINRNAEIFQPPYLFDASGALKSRPQITIAAEHAAYGETIPVGVSTTDISRVTLVKSSAVTHSWNSEQRFMELDFVADNGFINVTLPETANHAPPGYYLLHVLDDTGTPSVAHILKMGTEPAPDVEIEPPQPELPTDTEGSLLQNGGFESALTSWSSCGDANLVTAISDASDGAGAIQLSSTGCLYQEFSVSPGVEYTFTCDASIGASEYGSVFLQINDSNYTELALAEAQISGADYSEYSATLVAPNDATFASLGMYSEGNSRFDRCSVVVSGESVATPPSNETPSPNSANLLANGGFEQQKSAWFDCSSSTLTKASEDALMGNGAIEINGAGCLYQEIQVAPGAQYRFHCSAKSDNVGYTSMTVQITDQSRIELANVEVPIGNDTYRSYEKTLTAPQDSLYSAITLYSEDNSQFDNCFVEAL